MKLISKDDTVHHLMSIIPRVQFLVQWAVSQLGGVGVHVCESEARHRVREGVCVKGVCHVGISTLHTIHCIKHAANQEGVAIATSPKTCAKGPYRLQISRTEMDEQDHFLVEALCVQSGVEQPQARLINSKLHLENVLFFLTKGCNLENRELCISQISLQLKFSLPLAHKAIASNSVNSTLKRKLEACSSNGANR